MITDQRTLTQFLSELDSPREDWYLYIDPNDIDDWRMGYYKFHYGERIPIGPLSRISFGRQDHHEALLAVLHHQANRPTGWLDYKGNTVVVNVAKIVELYGKGKLDYEFESTLQELVKQTMKDWSLRGAQTFVSEVLPYQIKPRVS